jgi:hypothetical protein
MYVCIYGPSFPGLGLGGWVGLEDSLYKVSYKSKYGSKVIWRGVVGGVIWLHPRISRAKWKHFMIDKTCKFVIENHTIHLQMEAFYMIDKAHKFVIENPMIHLHPPNIHALVDFRIGMKDMITYIWMKNMTTTTRYINLSLLGANRCAVSLHSSLFLPFELVFFLNFNSFHTFFHKNKRKKKKKNPKLLDQN